MLMSSARDEMIVEIKKIIIPVLREIGFSGSFPHLRRISERQIDLLTFQFNRHGGSFVIEIAVCKPTGFTTHWGKLILPNKVRAHDLHPYQRLRLGAPSSTEEGIWFSYDPVRGGIFNETALQVLPLLKSQAEPYWQKALDLN